MCRPTLPDRPCGCHHRGVMLRKAAFLEKPTMPVDYGVPSEPPSAPEGPQDEASSVRVLLWIAYFLALFGGVFVALYVLFGINR